MAGTRGHSEHRGWARGGAAGGRFLRAGQPGWNLALVPLQPATTVISGVLALIAQEHDLVYAYSVTDAADPWKLCNVAVLAVLNGLAEMAPGKGYWIHAMEACTRTAP